MLPVRLANGQNVTALCYIVDRRHQQYAGNLSVDDAARIVTGGVGQSGRNEDYLFNTVEHLKALGIRDQWLESVAERIAPV
jgi:glutathione-specific gamma-glutamylcyclotransferase